MYKKWIKQRKNEWKYARCEGEDVKLEKQKKLATVILNCDIFDEYVKNISQKAVDFSKCVW